MRFPSHVVRLAPLSLIATLLYAPAVSGQTLGGQVVQLDTKKPLGGAAVALVNDSARVVATTSAGPDGSFYLDAPGAGGYRVVLFVAGASFVSPAVQIDSGKTIERLFSVPNVPESFASALFARDVTTAAVPLPGSPVPAYPASQLDKGARAQVIVMFVVDEKGIPDLTTYQVLNTTDDAFVSAIRDALVHTRFVPADKDGSAVRQVVQYTYDFGLADDPPRGDVVIRPRLAKPKPVAEKKSGSKGGRYMVTSLELGTPEIEGLPLIEALHRLRPAMFNETLPVGVQASYEPGPVYVDGVRADGPSVLSEMHAGSIEQVRFLPHQEAAIKYGMQYAWAVLITTRIDKQ